VIGVEDWAEIRRLHRAEGLSARAVARQLGISRGNQHGSSTVFDQPTPRPCEI
jgi:hypothetical protein